MKEGAMLRKLLLVAALIATPAYADNFNVKDAGGVTIAKKSKTVSGAEADQNILIDNSGNAVIGEVTANPTANTVLDRLKTIATNTAGGGGSVSISQTTPGTTNGVVVNSGTVAATQSGTWNVNNIAGTVSLPTGASTSAAQTTGNNSLSSIDTKLSSQATAANQTTGNSSLSTIATQTTTTATNTGSTATNTAPFRAGTGNRVITRISVTSSGSQVICPANANVVSTKIQFFTTGVGINDNGVSLTTGTPGTGSTTPNRLISQAGIEYSYTVPPTNDVTIRAVDATGEGLAICTQETR